MPPRSRLNSLVESLFDLLCYRLHHLNNLVNGASKQPFLEVSLIAFILTRCVRPDEASAFRGPFQNKMVKGTQSRRLTRHGSQMVSKPFSVDESDTRGRNLEASFFAKALHRNQLQSATDKCPPGCLYLARVRCSVWWVPTVSANRRRSKSSPGS